MSRDLPLFTADQILASTIPVVDSRRTCGGCTLCCTVLAVAELQKPENQPCPHQMDFTLPLYGDGEVRCAGCAVYDDRPQSCRDFACLWLMGFGPEDARPQESRVVVWKPDIAKPLIVATVDPATPWMWKEGPASDILEQWTSRGYLAIVAIGPKHLVVGRDPAQVQAYMKSQQEEGGL